MSGPVIYLDSSAIVKRYVLEPGSQYVRSIYARAYEGEAKIPFSVWNIGEVLGALDRARRLGRLDEKAYRTARRRFIGETQRMSRTGTLILVPVALRILREAWRITEEHHVYAAVALQVASAKHIGAAEFVTGDQRLHEAASAEGLRSTPLP